jgi:1-deoxy-D-xylulose 5-phosphate reductoisomerase
VEAFLLGRIGFMTIPKVVEAVLEVSVSEIGLARASTLDEVLEADRAARLLAERFCAAYRL